MTALLRSLKMELVEFFLGVGGEAIFACSCTIPTSNHDLPVPDELWLGSESDGSAFTRYTRIKQ